MPPVHPWRTADGTGGGPHGIGLAASPGKTEALLIHPLALARQYVHQLRIGNTPSHGGGRSQTDHIPGACDRSQADLKHAAKSITAKVHRVQGAVRRLQQHGRGCTVRWGLRLNQVAASSTLLYVLPLLMLSPARQQQLEGLHRRDTILGLPKESPVAATLAEAGYQEMELSFQEGGNIRGLVWFPKRFDRRPR